MAGSTRSKARGGKPSSSAPTTRQRRGNQGKTAASPPSTAPAQRRNSRSATAVVNDLSSLARDPVPRRGARPGPAPSVASIATDPAQPDDSDEVEEAEEENGIEEENAESGIDENAEEEDADEREESDEDESLENQLRVYSLADLASSADDLVKRLQNMDGKSRLHQQLLTMKRDSFAKVREIFESADSTSFFLDYAWAERLPQSTDLELGASIAIGIANAAILLDAVQLISTEAPDLLPFVEQMDDFLPFVFYLNSVQPQDVELSLLVRTHLFIEQLAAKKTKINMRSLIKETFCAGEAQGDDATIFAHGPFKDLAGQNDIQVVDLCAERVQQLYELVRNEKKHAAVDRLRNTFPLADLLSSLKAWATDVYQAKSGRLPEASEAWRALKNEPDEFHDAEEEILDADSDEESQPVMRFDNGEPSQISLFRNASSIRVLDNKDSRSPVNDYQIRNQDLLARRSPSIDGALSSSRKRAFAATSNNDNDDDDDEDMFETDTRQVDRNKRARISSGLADVKHRQSTVPHPSSLQPSPVSRNPGASQRHIPLSGYTAVNSPPASSAVEAERMRARKEALMAMHGAANAASASPATTAGPSALVQNPHQRRQAWTDSDSLVLLELIRDYDAKWSVMERHNHRFQYARNQQAYRDRARNLKVDYLITDRVLPPGFDKVALGKKEITKVMEAGKNPFRLEYEIGGDGRAVNTEYDPNPSALQ